MIELEHETNRMVNTGNIQRASSLCNSTENFVFTNGKINKRGYSNTDSVES